MLGTASPGSPCSAGMQQASSRPSEPQTISGSTTQKPLPRTLVTKAGNSVQKKQRKQGTKRKKEKERGSSTPESAVTARKKTSRGKSKTSVATDPTTGSSPTLAPASTSNARAFAPWYNQSARVASQRLWSCTRTDCAGTVSSSWSKSFSSLGQNSWFKIAQMGGKENPEPQEEEEEEEGRMAPPPTCASLQTTSLQSQRSLWQDITAGEAPRSAGIGKLRPSPPPEATRNPQKKQKHKRSRGCRGSGISRKVDRHYAMHVERQDKDEKGDPLATQKIRLYPDPPQKRVLNRWFAAFRWTYNQCVADPCGCNLAALRKKYVNEDSLQKNFPGEAKWVLTVPQCVRYEAVRDFLQAHSDHRAKQRAQRKRGEKVQTKFELKFKSVRRDPQQTVPVSARQWKTKRATKSKWGAEEFSVSKVFGHTRMRCERSYTFPRSLPHDSSLSRTRTGKYYLCVPRPLKRMAPPSHVPASREHAVVAIDPGVRTFGTSYDARGQVHEFGKGAAYHLIKTTVLRVDKLKSKMDRMEKEGKLNHRKRYRMRLALLRKQERARNKVKEFHRKYAKWLCDNYSVILLPKFETQEMVQKITLRKRGPGGSLVEVERQIGSKTARAMCTMSHFGFRQHLLQKARAYDNCNVIICNEAYTSKTCGRCGGLNSNLGSSKHFRCSFCPYEADRDANGARNIMVKYLAGKKAAAGRGI